MKITTQRKKNKGKNTTRRTLKTYVRYSSPNSVKHNTLIKSTFESAYSIPIRNLSEHYSIRFINAHGDISPEIFYVVPDKTHIIMPNVCGVPTSTSQTFTNPLYQSIDEAIKSFENKFVKQSIEKDTTYTVYTPGSIIPMQTFLFDPTLPFNKNNLLVGFVGVFGPSSFFENSFIKNVVQFKLADADNVLSVPWKKVNLFLFEILEHIRIYLNSFDKDSKGRPITPIYRIYKIILDTLSESKIPIRQSLEEDTRTIFSYGPMSYERTGIDEYILGLIREKIDIPKINGIKYTKSLEAIRYLLPLIPENILGELVSQSMLENIHKKLTRISINKIVEKTHEPSIDTYYVVNACRSLMESKENTPSEFNFLANETKESVSTVENKYTKIDTSKYSAALISKMDTLTKENERNPNASINMNKINELRLSKGLKKYVQSVMNYRELYELFSDIVKINEPDEKFIPMINSVHEILKILEEYAPKEKVKATINTASEAEFARVRATEINTEDRKKEIEQLERRRKTIAGTIRELKTMKKSVTGKSIPAAAATAAATEREERIANLKKELAEIDKTLRPVE